jgi:hypothetical protein
MRALGRPPRITNATPRLRPERQAVRLRALLLRFQLRTNNDYELVLAHPRDPEHTAVAVIPSPDCTAGAQHRVAMTRARNTFNRECLNLRHPALVTITGVLFFAASPRAARAELAPLLTFSSSC